MGYTIFTLNCRGITESAYQMKLKTLPRKTIVITDDFWYDLTDGGYIAPTDFLEAEDANKVETAIETILEFEQLLVDNGILEYN